MDRVFLDANVLFSAAYRPDSGLRRLWTLPAVTLLTSAYAATEARRNLATAEQRAQLTTLLEPITTVPDSPEPFPIPPTITLPPKDRPILGAAIHAQATHLLTGDVTHFGPYYGQTIAGVTILRPAGYLRAQQHTGSAAPTSAPPPQKAPT